MFVWGHDTFSCLTCLLSKAVACITLLSYSETGYFNLSTTYLPLSTLQTRTFQQVKHALHPSLTVNAHTYIVHSPEAPVPDLPLVHEDSLRIFVQEILGQFGVLGDVHLGNLPRRHGCG